MSIIAFLVVTGATALYSCPSIHGEFGTIQFPTKWSFFSLSTNRLEGKLFCVNNSIKVDKLPIKNPGKGCLSPYRDFAIIKHYQSLIDKVCIDDDKYEERLSEIPGIVNGEIALFRRDFSDMVVADKVEDLRSDPNKFDLFVQIESDEWSSIKRVIHARNNLNNPEGYGVVVFEKVSSWLGRIVTERNIRHFLVENPDSRETSFMGGSGTEVVWSVYRGGDIIVNSAKINSSECCICCEDFEDSSIMTVTKCGHWYHYRCLGEWIGKNSICPLCRSVIV